MSNFHKILPMLLSLIYGHRKRPSKLGKLNRTLHEILSIDSQGLARKTLMKVEENCGRTVELFLL